MDCHLSVVGRLEFSLILRAMLSVMFNHFHQSYQWRQSRRIEKQNIFQQSNNVATLQVESSNNNNDIHAASYGAQNKSLHRGIRSKSKLQSYPQADRHRKPPPQSTSIWVTKWGQRTENVLYFDQTDGI